jgi:hypothetical protein
MKPNRARRNGDKKRNSAQSAKSTSPQGEKPVVENPDIDKLLCQAVRQILESNQTRYGLTGETIIEHLPQFGFNARLDQVQQALEKLEADGAAYYVGEFWRQSPPPANDPQQHALLALLELLPSSKIEDSTKKAGALLELFRCKLMADAGETIFPSLPDFDEVESQKVCGMMDLIREAQAAIDKAYTASNKFVKEFRRLAGMPV